MSMGGAGFESRKRVEGTSVPQEAELGNRDLIVSPELTASIVATAILEGLRRELALHSEATSESSKRSFCRNLLSRLTPQQVRSFQLPVHTELEFSDDISLSDVAVISRELLRLFDNACDTSEAKKCGVEYALDGVIGVMFTKQMQAISPSLGTAEALLCSAKINGGFLGTFHEFLTDLRLFGREDQLEYLRTWTDSLTLNTVEANLPDFASEAVFSLVRAENGAQMFSTIKEFGQSLVRQLECSSVGQSDVIPALDVLNSHVFVRIGKTPPTRRISGSGLNLDLVKKLLG